MIIFTDSFLQKELKPLKLYYSINDIKKAAQKIHTSAVSLANFGYKDVELYKMRMPSRVSGRLIVFVFVIDERIVPLVVRLKSDKSFGQNLSLNNPKGKALIIDNLRRSFKDIKAGRYIKEDI